MPRAVKPLKWLVADLLASRVDELVALAGETLLALPPDVRAALVAVARRRGCLDDAALCALVDETATSLDVSTCGARVTDAGIARLASRRALRSVVAADVSRCAGITPEGLGALVAAAPRLRVLRCGGDAVCDATARRAIAPSDERRGVVLPHLLGRRDRAEASSSSSSSDDDDVSGTWEDLLPDEAESESEADADRPSSSPSRVARPSSIARGAEHLAWLVWPDADETSRDRISRRCPRVRLVAPSRAAVARLAAAERSAATLRFVAVPGEGWVGVDESDRGGGVELRLTHHRPREERGGLNPNDPNDPHPHPHRAGEMPWWAADRDRSSEDRRVGRYSTFGKQFFWERQMSRADPTRALDSDAVRWLDPKAFAALDRSSPLPKDGAARVLSGSKAATLSPSAPLRWRLRFAEDLESAPSVAERFRAACESVRAERSARRAKNRTKARNRAINRLGSAEKHIYRAMEDE